MRIQAPDSFFRLVADQLGNPHGFLGGFVARSLNKGNGGLIRRAVTLLELRPGEVTADIGFGGGHGLGELLGATAPTGRVHGVDPSPDMRTRADRTYSAEVSGGRLEIHDGRLESLPFSDGQIDGWISLNTITFVPHLPTAFAELHRITAADGRGVVGIGDPEWMTKLPFTRHGFRLRPLDEVEHALSTAGFAVDRRSSEVAGHRYVMFVVRPNTG